LVMPSSCGHFSKKFKLKKYILWPTQIIHKRH
jgi:hypothetical protein